MAITAREQAVAQVRAAREDKRLSNVHRRRARQRFQEAEAFCRAVGIDFEEIRTEATGHGPREDEATPA